MHLSHRGRLVLGRLCLIFIALCLVLTQLELSVRLLRDQSAGMPNPLFPRDPLPPTSRVPFLGISINPADLDLTHMDTTEPVTPFQTLVAAGFGWVRVEVAWDHVQPAPRTFVWEPLDRTLDALAAARLTPVLLLNGSPAWVRAPNDRKGASGRFAPPGNPAAFARFAAAVAERYGDQVRYYQIWDEPNIAPHWGARHIEPVNYARMLKAASAAVRAVDPDAYIILAALAPTADRGHLAQDEAYYLSRIYAAGAAPYFDAVAIQPFGFARRADDLAVNRYTLNFRRALLVRQIMLDAGDGTTPVWLMRFGWNRSPGSPWQSVSPEQQRVYTFDALAMAFRQWPWVVAMGWPAAFVSADDPAAGFGLTPELLATFTTASDTFLAQHRPRHTPTAPPAWWTPTALWLLATLGLLWRGYAAARQLPWAQWGKAWSRRPAWQQGIAWALLLLLYFWGVWPPLLLLYAIVAALGFLVQPRLGLALALFVLPLYDYHKEFDWLGQHWMIPPTQAALLCMIPAIWRDLSHTRPHTWPRDRWNAVALGWLGVALLGATGTWYWPPYWIGMLNLVVTPLLLFGLIRAWVTTQQEGVALVAALAAGGVFIAGIGLVEWVQGTGTVVDGMRRLTGLGYSSNHTALYLIRTVAITVGLMLAARSHARWLWLLWTAIAGVALLLTGSRGAVVLGIPAGALFLFSRHTLRLPSRRRLIGVGAVSGVALAILAWMWRARLGNIDSIVARMDGWSVSVYLWFNHFLFGVGPESFWWTFPAHMWLASDADPNLRHPHNVWLEMATSGGLLALIWLVWVIILLYRWVQHKRGPLATPLTWVQIGLLTGLIAALAHAQVDAFQALSELAGWNWAALGLLLALDRARPMHE